ncbi:TetR/AcrR family transcriptional regulator [Haliea sp. E17]|uniref:TetR/AcrR family transcriptional regulator n=1 Tax=Haliea sp. E17 TaxID=3401576 RepID=UPI003AAB95C0
MTATTSIDKAPAPRKRRYNSPLRQQQSADTREKIIDAGVKLVQSFTTWDWTNLTASAVSDSAGVSERTVYRHFTTERNLRDSVMQRLVADSGIDLSTLRMEDFASTTEHMFRFLSAFATRVESEKDPTFATIDEERRLALRESVARSLKGTNEQQQTEVAAMLDLFWNPPYYERLVADWQLPPERASQLIGWMIGNLLEAVKGGKLP